MKKISLRLSCIFFILVFAFVSIPFQPVNANTSWDNIIYSIKANLGMVNVANGSLSALDNNDFYASLYETTLAWNNVSFVPADTFNNKAHWVQCCNSRGVSDVVGFTDFDIVSCLEQSGYISRSDSGYDFSNIPRLGDNFQNTQKPLEGIEIYTSFDFQPDYSITFNPIYSENFVNNLFNQYVSEYNNVYLFSGRHATNTGRYVFGYYSFDDNVDFVTFINKNSDKVNKNSPWFYVHTTNNDWVNDFSCSSYIQFSNSQLQYNYYSTDYTNTISNPSFYESGITSISNVRYSPNFLKNGFTFKSNFPIVFASSTSYAQNYYYWLHGSPSGVYYSTANSGNVYSTEYIENNDWSQIYNNYVTDVSNYYSTNENITNENLTQYIDNSTTITNITNNYITNNNGGGEDDIITNSWLERIYNLLLDFYFAFIGQPSSGSGDNNTFYTDNSVKNDIVNYPLSEFFPDVPSDYFISENESFSIPLFNQKTARVLQTAMPFCYLEKLKYIASFVATPPQTPHYEIPFVIDSFGIDETVTISFEDNAWGVLHSVWIALFMIIFVIALFYFTYRFILLVSSILG